MPTEDVMPKASTLSSAWWVAALLGLLTAATAAGAQEWPMRQPIRVVAPASAGSTVDVMARLIYEQVGRQLGQSVVIENRGGAGTTTGMAYVAKSAPDGYTILVNSISYAVVASTYARLPYDPREDMTGIALLAHIPFVVATSTKYKTLADFAAAGQKRPSPLNYGSPGLGSSGHLATERLLRACKSEATHVPFRGTVEALTEIIAGRLDMYMASLANAGELAQAGKINMLGVTTRQRSSLFPDVPTTIEAGCPNSEYNYWVGSYLPAKTPRAIIDRLNTETHKALQTPQVKAKLALLGGELELMSVDRFNAFIKSERDVNESIVKLIGFTPQ
jgi:tripartite-type tricarboxylate transporter receptor subunit TctC